MRIPAVVVHTISAHTCMHTPSTHTPSMHTHPARTHTHTIHTHTRKHTHHPQTHTHTRTRTCTNTHIRARTNTHMHARMHARTHTHTHMHTHTHIRIHTHTHIHTLCPFLSHTAPIDASHTLYPAFSTLRNVCGGFVLCGLASVLARNVFLFLNALALRGPPNCPFRHLPLALGHVLDAEEHAHSIVCLCVYNDLADLQHAKHGVQNG